MTLNLAPRKPRVSPQPPSSLQQTQTQSDMRPPGAATSSAHPLYSRPSSSNSTSSLTGALGANAAGSRPTTSQGRMGPPDSTARHGDDDAASASDTDAARPTFKRLASQTLGPENAKRTMLAYPAEDGSALEDGDDEDVYTAAGALQSEDVSARPVVSLSDRYRRLSVPSATA
jgi:hypothetical protein